MKKIRLLIFAAFAASAVSCSGFLDSFPSYAVDTSVSVTDSVAIALTNGCYNPLQSSNLYNMRIWSLDIIAGNSEVGGGGGRRHRDSPVRQFRCGCIQCFCTLYMEIPVGRHRPVQHRHQVAHRRRRPDIGKHPQQMPRRSLFPQGTLLLPARQTVRRCSAPA